MNHSNFQPYLSWFQCGRTVLKMRLLANPIRSSLFYRSLASFLSLKSDLTWGVGGPEISSIQFEGNRYILKSTLSPVLPPPAMATTTTTTSSSTSISSSCSRTVMDVEMDALVHCANYLNLQDISSMAMTCKFFKTAAYSDSIWQRLFREHWPNQILSSSSYNQISPGVREAYLARYNALQKFKFIDPLSTHLTMSPRSYNHILLDKNAIILSQGSVIQMVKNAFSHVFDVDSFVTMQDHKARITCMRLFSLSETSLFRSKAQEDDNVLVTSSSDHSIRLWWMDRCQRCFRGHNGPVTTLADKLLGDCGGKVLASGGEDSTVRIWSVSSSGKRGQHALKTTYFGHERPIMFLSVSGHKTSLLVSISKDTKVRVWDTNISSVSRSSGCVGMTSLLGAPVGMKCHESLCYIAAGSSVTSIDLRTMRKAFTAAVHQPKFYSFEFLPSESLICTGGDNKAMLWDIRKSQEKPEPVAELDGHVGPVSQLHMDGYKIVTGGRADSHVRVWETNTGRLTNSLVCCLLDEPESKVGCSAMAVNGYRIATASCGEEPGYLYLRDFRNATCSVPSNEDDLSSKFWEPNAYYDSS